MGYSSGLEALKKLAESYEKLWNVRMEVAGKMDRMVNAFVETVNNVYRDTVPGPGGIDWFPKNEPSKDESSKDQYNPPGGGDDGGYAPVQPSPPDGGGGYRPVEPTPPDKRGAGDTVPGPGGMDWFSETKTPGDGASPDTGSGAGDQSAYSRRMEGGFKIPSPYLQNLEEIEKKAVEDYEKGNTGESETGEGEYKKIEWNEDTKKDKLGVMAEYATRLAQDLGYIEKKEETQEEQEEKDQEETYLFPALPGEAINQAQQAGYKPGAEPGETQPADHTTEMAEAYKAFYQEQEKEAEERLQEESYKAGIQKIQEKEFSDAYESFHKEQEKERESMIDQAYQGMMEAFGEEASGEQEEKSYAPEVKEFAEKVVSNLKQNYGVDVEVKDEELRELQEAYEKGGGKISLEDAMKYVMSKNQEAMDKLFPREQEAVKGEQETRKEQEETTYPPGGVQTPREWIQGVEKHEQEKAYEKRMEEGLEKLAPYFENNEDSVFGEQYSLGGDSQQPPGGEKSAPAGEAQGKDFSEMSRAEKFRGFLTKPSVESITSEGIQHGEYVLENIRNREKEAREYGTKYAEDFKSLGDKIESDISRLREIQEKIEKGHDVRLEEIQEAHEIRNKMYSLAGVFQRDSREQKE